jgi:hypothetical protein
MAYNVSYSTLPTFTSDSIGNIIVKIGSNDTSGWFNVTTTLTPGIWSLNANICFNSSQNSYAYIALDPSNYNNNNLSIFDYQENFETGYSTYQHDIPDTSVFISGGSYSTYYPVACQQMRNGISGSSSALSLSCIVQGPLTGSCDAYLLYYNENNNNKWCAILTATRIA